MITRKNGNAKYFLWADVRVYLLQERARLSIGLSKNLRREVVQMLAAEDNSEKYSKEFVKLGQ